MIRTFTRQPFYHKRRRQRLFSKILSQSLTDTLSLSQTVDTNNQKSVSVSQSISFSDSFSKNVVQQKSIPQTISFSDSVSNTHVHIVSITQTLSFTNIASQNRVKVESISQTLLLSSSVDHGKNLGTTYTVIISPCQNKTLIDTFALYDCVKYTFTHRNIAYQRIITDTLSLTQTITPHKLQSISRTKNDSLSFTQTIAYFVVSAVTTVKSISQTLTFSHSISTSLGSVYTKSIFQTLTFTQSLPLKKIRLRTVSQTITFTQSISKSKHSTIHYTDTLILVPTLSRKNNYKRSLSQILPLSTNSYSQNFNNELVLIPTVINILNPARLRKYKFLQLDVPGNNIVLPAPEFENSYKSGNFVRVDRTMTGGIRSFIKVNKLIGLKYNFILTQSKRFELLSFLKANNTKKMIITDWKNAFYIALLAADSLSANSSGNDKVELELEFNAIRVG